MKKSILILMMVTTGLLCSGQSSKSTPDSVYIGTLDSTKNVQSQSSFFMKRLKKVQVVDVSMSNHKI